jgi:hypothetical protein
LEKSLTGNEMAHQALQQLAAAESRGWLPSLNYRSRSWKAADYAAAGDRCQEAGLDLAASYLYGISDGRRRRKIAATVA